ncbi:MAG: histone deacetylase [Calditrichae bacterium]|nr:histone deacetylase [Calditrichia bacterium]
MSAPYENLIFYYHPVFLEHLSGIQHPENPDRLRTIVNYLREQHVWDKLQVKPPPQAEIKWIETNHSSAYIRSVEEACQRAPAVLDGGDTVVTSQSYQAALHAVGACLSGVDDLMNDRTDSVFCAVRPPGHHAEYDRAMGFCLFNNIAITARYALDYYSLQRVFILDWDIHHGNGTHYSFNHRPEIFFCSVHQWPLYPGTGAADERGQGVGEGYTMNIPMPPGESDESYLAVLKDKIIPALRHYRPDLLLLSAGFDAHEDDPLAEMRVSTEGYRQMTQLLRQEMKNLNGAKILSVLEGGYNQQNLAKSVLAHLEALVEES